MEKKLYRLCSLPVMSSRSLRRCVSILAFIMLFIQNTALATDSSSRELSQKPKYRLSICAIFNDEAPYFKEWIEYHRLLGVEHFYLYNNESSDNFQEVLAPYIKENVVTLIDWPNRPLSDAEKAKPCAWVGATQIPAYEDACQNRGKGETEWLALIDVDEFLVPGEETSLLDVLDKYRSAPGVAVKWHTFGTSNVNELPKGSLLIEYLHMTCAPEHSFNGVFKTILKPDLYAGFIWPPHVCRYANDQSSVPLNKNELRINHYIYRTKDYFYGSKIRKKEKMDNIKLSESQISSWVSVGNDVLDRENTIAKFVPDLRQKMGYPNSNRILIHPGYWGDFFNPVHNRDGSLEPIWHLRDFIEKWGYKLEQTTSLKNLKDFKYLILFDVFPENLEDLKRYPKEKLILFLWEPTSIKPENFKKEYHEYFSKIYTWDDSLVDNIKYFKLHYPVLKPLTSTQVDFQSKKLCTLIAFNKQSSHPNELYKKQRKIIEFFERFHPQEFTLFGAGWPSSYKTNRGSIEKKEAVLKNFKFSLAYENISVPGHVTEKIFDSFQAGCVPVYLGASNISEYIPQECYIPGNKFKGYEDLYHFMKNMSEAEYNVYLNNIKKFLNSEKAKVFTEENFILMFMNLIGVNTDMPIAKKPSNDLVDLVIFSYNRPLQLHALLESLEKYVTGLNKISLIYRASDAEFEVAYRAVKDRFPDVDFYQQGANPNADFKPLVLQAVNATPGKYILFAVDDQIVKEPISLEACTEALEKYKAYVFHLRMGKNITQSYTAKKSFDLPKLTKMAPGLFAWQSANQADEWNYPHSVDMSLYRKAEIKHDLDNLSYSNPNTLEFEWFKSAQRNSLNKLCLCYETSKVVNVPLNVVQEAWQNHSMNLYSTKDLLKKFNENLKIDISPLSKAMNKAPHMEYVPTFIERDKPQKSSKKNIGVLITATGRYIKFVPPLIESAKKHFLKNHHVNYFVFTEGDIPPYSNVFKIQQHRLGWPYDTLKRFELYYNNRNLLDKMDYLFAIDADMLFVNDIDEEILSDRVATRHPLFADRTFISEPGIYETNPISKACVSGKEGEYYFCGGFYGGSKNEFLKLLKTCIDNINDDLKTHNFIAVWHDESHLNRYFIDHKPTQILSSNYCVPEEVLHNYPNRKILALHKSNAEKSEIRADIKNENYDTSLKSYELFWEKNIGSLEIENEMRGWYGDESYPGRCALRNQLKTKKYKSILDVGASFCTEYFGIQKEKIPIDYTALDISKKFIDKAIAQGINAKKGSVESIPYEDSTFDIAYTRHLLEHLPNYEKAISELIRVAKNEVFIVFFHEPSNLCDKIELYDVYGDPVYANNYNKNKLQKFIAANKKVKKISWEPSKKESGSDETVLHIYLNEEGEIPTQNSADMVTFSCNRPLQLYAYLESVQKYIDGIHKHYVIYRADNEYLTAYDQVQQTFPEVEFIKQGNDPGADFKPLVLKCTFGSPSDYVLYGVDDIIVKDYVDLSECIKAMQTHKAYGFYLRMGLNITENFTENRPSPIPLINEVESGIFAWQFKDAAAPDWNWPQSVDMTLYKKSEIESDLYSLNFANPNRFEGNWSLIADMNKTGLCYKESKMVNLPLNLVQTNWLGSRHMEGYSPHELLKKFESGLKMDINPLFKIQNKAPHMVYDPTFVSRNALEPFVFCTASDEKYFDCLINLIGSIHKYNFNELGEVAVFDLGMTPNQLKELSSIDKVKVYNFQITNPDLLKPFLTRVGDKPVPGWYAWKPVAIKQALDLFPTILWIDAGTTVLKPLNALFNHIREKGYFLYNETYHGIREMCTQHVINKFKLNTPENKWIISDGTFGVDAGFMGLTRKVYDRFVLPMYELTRDLTNFADDGTAPGGFGWARHDQALFSIHARLLGLQIYQSFPNKEVVLHSGNEDFPVRFTCSETKPVITETDNLYIWRSRRQIDLEHYKKSIKYNDSVYAINL